MPSTFSARSSRLRRDFAGVSGQVRADDYPSKPINIIVSGDAGGATDRAARALAPILSENLGVPVNVENKPGARTLIAHTYIHQQPDDGYTFVYTAANYIVGNIIDQNATFTLDDFAWVNVLEIGTSVIFVHKDAPYQSFLDMVEALKEPGKVACAVNNGSSEHVLAMLMMDELGLPRENLRLVTYDGGGAARTALAGGQVDCGLLTAEGSDVIAEFVRPLTIFRDQPLEGFDAPPVNEVLEPMGVTMPVIPSSMRLLAARAAFAENYPERFAKFTEALEKTILSEEFQANARENKRGAEWHGPEESKRLVLENAEQVEQFRTVLAGQ